MGNLAAVAVTREQFVRSICASRLMTAEDVRAFVDSLPPGQPHETAQDLAKALVNRERLTRFQAIQLYQGHTRGLVLGNYVILDRLGEGGMGLVYKARHGLMKRVVALKMLPPQVTDPEHVRRFRREVEAAARLNHPHIVTAYDAHDVDGFHFLVMEYIEGSDLGRYVRRCGRLAQRTAVDYTCQAARGLLYAHEQGVIHRDIKPGNLLLDHQGVVRVLDMGLARFDPAESAGAEASSEGLTGSGRVMGTVDYLAPEQAIDARKADRRADIYSLGCSLYFLLTGESPVPQGSLAEKLMWHQQGPPPALQSERPDVQPELLRVFQQMMARQLEQRYPSCEPLIADLNRCLERIKSGDEATLDTNRPPLQSPQLAPRRDDELILAELVAEIPPVAINTMPISLDQDQTLAGTVRDRGSVTARRDQQIRVVGAIVVAVGLLIGLLLWLFGGDDPNSSLPPPAKGSQVHTSLAMPADADRPRTVDPVAVSEEAKAADWDPLVRRLIEQVFEGGVFAGAGRQVYSDMSAAIDSDKEGDWLVGPGMTRDGEAYHFAVRAGQASVSQMSARQLAAAKLTNQQISRSIDRTFQMRVEQLITLASAQLRVERDTEGALRVTGLVDCHADGLQTIEDAILVLTIPYAETDRTGEMQIFQYLKEAELKTGLLLVDMELPKEPAATFTAQLHIIGFLYQPKPGNYRLSNHTTCQLNVPAAGH